MSREREREVTRRKRRQRRNGMQVAEEAGGKRSIHIARWPVVFDTRPSLHFDPVLVRWLVPFVGRRSKTAIFFLPRRICGGTKGIACISLVPVARELRVHFHPALIVLDLVNTFPEYGGKCY